jgi:hypothetical protein
MVVTRPMPVEANPEASSRSFTVPEGRLRLDWYAATSQRLQLFQKKFRSSFVDLTS